MDRQAVFDKAAATLIAQGGRSTNGTKCLYRGPNGAKCAVGALIPDEDYRPMMEAHGGLCSNAPVRAALTKSYPDITDADFIFLEELQGCHDSTVADATLPARLWKFATEHDLVFNG